MNKTSNIFYVLRDREYGKFPNKLSLLNLPDPIDSRSDSQCGGIKKLLKELQVIKNYIIDYYNHK